MQGKAKLSHGSMTASLQRILFVTAASLIAADLVWGISGRFQVDVIAYLRLGALSLALLGAGIFYQTRRDEPCIAAMLLGACFLCAFSAAASLFNYFLLTFHGPRIDVALAAADRALGFDWVGVMTAMTAHPLLGRLLFLVYNSVLPQIALMMMALGWSGSADKTYRFCIAIASGALVSILVWTAAPSFGAMSIHALPQGVARSVAASVDSEYGRVLVAMLRNGPGFISPADVRGLIGFPSYHGALALIVAWYARSLPRLFWPLLIVNVLVLVATPVQGGHHLVDVLASFPVAALAIFLSRLRENAESSAKSAAMVNKVENLNIGPVPTAFFRASSGQTHANVRRAIKSKLSGVS
jgi:PAP2 superfamily